MRSTPQRRLRVPALVNLIGNRFGRLVVRAYAGDRKWSCVCDCDARVLVRADALRTGRSRSCGCLQRELTSARFSRGRELRRIDLAGKRFGRWIVLGYAGGKHCKWCCICDCGTKADVRGADLRGGISKSCGCLQRELTGDRARIHGMCGTPEYRSWHSMKARCRYPCVNGFEYYGGRGIKPCDEWLSSFVAYFADTGTRPPGCSLDRIDPNGNYEPGNVQWATPKQQAQNRRPPRKRGTVKRRQELPPLDEPPY
jgi:hypothetical protein